MPIRAYLGDHLALDPEALQVLSQAFEGACTALQVDPSATHERRVIAARILDLARSGVIDAKALRDRVVLEARSASPD